MSNPTPDLTLCDHEPIHIPGSIQPHGVMLVVDHATMRVTHAAGDAGAQLSRDDWRGALLADLLGAEVAARAQNVAISGKPQTTNRTALPGSATVDLLFHRSGRHLIVEVEPSPNHASTTLLNQLETAAALFEQAINLTDLFNAAAIEFRAISGFDRVMVYQFLDDDAGVVVGESIAAGLSSFHHHRFPASDIPKQARALYGRNLVRVIPDIHYVPAPLVPAWQEADALDMSDSVLRSVSPIHLQYMKNMGVGASASVSIVKDGALWGLIACHHAVPRGLSADVRAALRALAAGLSRQIKAREETDAYRERVRLRTFEDDIVALLSREGSLDQAISNHLDEIMRMLDADGLAVLRGRDLVRGGRTPPEEQVRSLATWALTKSSETVFATNRLSEHHTLPAASEGIAAGLLALTLSASEPWIILWFRAEQVAVVEWAGNPHAKTAGPGGVLTPRGSFEAWTETVRGRARRWSIPEIEAAARLRAAVTGVWQSRRIQDLNRQLMATLDEKDLLLQQKEFLIGEVNHRVQNSLQLVSTFLGLQARASDDATLQRSLEEARQRISAVSQVHRRLYRADQIDTVNAARYFDELLDDMIRSMGADWAPHIGRDIEPIMLPTDRAVAIGLVLTELVINANKYAYGGKAGPLRIALAEDRARFRLIVTDEGIGRSSNRRGFGSWMIDTLVAQLGGSLDFDDNRPGTRATLSAPITSGRG